MANLNSLQTKVSTTLANIQRKGLAELMDILGESTAKDTRGANKKTATTELYTNIPVPPPKKSSGIKRLLVGDKPIAYGNYHFMIPVKHGDARINLEAGHKLRIQARGIEPVKVFSIIEIFDMSGLYYQIEARKET